MIGNAYYHVGVRLTYAYSGSNKNGWQASADYFDAGFANDNIDAYQVSSEGKLTTRYAVRDGNEVSGIRVAASVILNDLSRLGIEVSSAESKNFYIDVEKSLPILEADIESLRQFAKEIGYNVFLEG